MSDPNAFLRESRMSTFPAAQFGKIGDSHGGTISAPPKLVDNQFGRSLVLELTNPSYPEGGVTLWVKAGQMAAAMADASHGEIAEGGKLQVTLTEQRDTGKGNPLNIYEVRYEAPVAKVDVGSIFGDQGQ